MEKIYVESANTGIIYESDLPIYDYLKNNGNFLEFPGLYISKDLINNKSDYHLIYLNENLSATVRGLYTTFRNSQNLESLYILSLDSEDHYQFRAEIINKIMNKCELEYVSGRISDVSEYIDEKVKKIER